MRPYNLFSIPNILTQRIQGQSSFCICVVPMSDKATFRKLSILLWWPYCFRVKLPPVQYFPSTIPPPPGGCRLLSGSTFCAFHDGGSFVPFSSWAQKNHCCLCTLPSCCTQFSQHIHYFSPGPISGEHRAGDVTAKASCHFQIDKHGLMAPALDFSALNRRPFPVKKAIRLLFFSLLSQPRHAHRSSFILRKSQLSRLWSRIIHEYWRVSSARRLVRVLRWIYCQVVHPAEAPYRAMPTSSRSFSFPFAPQTDDQTGILIYNQALMQEHHRNRYNQLFRYSVHSLPCSRRVMLCPYLRTVLSPTGRCLRQNWFPATQEKLLFNPSRWNGFHSWSWSSGGPDTHIVFSIIKVSSLAFEWSPPYPVVVLLIWMF